ncbi:hypothetical protein COCC4DRAFT_134658 [Bipolaris maydis ATCC 48331]|uniref:Rhodopsin domain-containing protein n=2 Tax=Cochliobolus heterostrophus TaxID=5016 RepID=M2TLI7_COCH5|nr:uncharacterized protein COCC4DRAFT_134658 [Bipolaris maydis ATCC 48331]EMD87339.1 hypothetical protein COCHEDRAFT_1197455 [Bipolaris maydis C5]KAH7554745.1 hypothetical protein BM1_07406 [Bipolaris maydis]ENI06537.1 hypothetical protein COCC4DRAFT_134658 [Bipolaris maydis ATCC 48331]KAJ5023368.1 hypothetical protein J3E73DRAFT_384731 [Bipolaris maydis]KAJ5055880.1 hypothetical protein J3E74DRAFT_279837 [Bipolaris maydis]
MGGDASAVSPSVLPHASLAHDQGPIHLAIVVILVLIALVIYSLRVFTRARLLHSFGFDDGLMFLAALCAVGVFVTFTGLVELGLGREDRDTASLVESERLGPWIWALKSVYIFGLGLVKLSAAFTLLPVSNSRFHAYVYICRGVLIIGIMFLIFWHTLEWFISILIHCMPLVAAWDFSYGGNAKCMTQIESQHWAMANYITNAASSLLLVVLAVPNIFGSSFKIGVKVYLALTTVLALFSCAIAIIRSRMVVVSWAEVGDRGKYDLSFMTWGTVELTTAMIAVNLGTLIPLGGAIKTPTTEPPTRRSPPKISGPVAGSAIHVSHGDVDSIFNAEPSASSESKQRNSRYSGKTIMYRPNTAYFPASYTHPGLTRFHDDESNLDFDIETPSTRSTRKLRKPFPPSRFSGSTTYTVDTRRASDWSQLSGFTYYSHASSPEFSNSQESTNRMSVGPKELDEFNMCSGRDSGSGSSAGDENQEIRVVSDEERRSGGFPTIFLEDDVRHVYSPRY